MVEPMVVKRADSSAVKKAVLMDIPMAELMGWSRVVSSVASMVASMVVR